MKRVPRKRLVKLFECWEEFFDETDPIIKTRLNRQLREELDIVITDFHMKDPLTGRRLTIEQARETFRVPFAAWRRRPH